VRRRREVRDLEVDDVATAALDLARAREHAERALGAERRGGRGDRERRGHRAQTVTN
jgi:hypothetical protein